MPDIGLLQGPPRSRVVSAPPAPIAAPAPAIQSAPATFDEGASLEVAARSAPAEFAILRAPREPASVIEVAVRDAAPCAGHAPVVSAAPVVEARPATTIAGATSA